MSGTRTRISIHNLTYTYEKRGAAALNGVTFDVCAGEFVSILGANGSGKSTLLSCINGLCTPPAGAVTVYGPDGAAFDPARESDLPAIRRITGTVLQNPDNQIVASVVAEDCAFGPENMGLSPADIETRVAFALREAGIEALRDRSTQFLSGGEKQRLAIAGILAMGCDVFLFDESTSMIDEDGRESFYALIERFTGEGKTVIQITHIIEDAARAPRCIVLDNGSIVSDGKLPAKFLETAFGDTPPPGGFMGGGGAPRVLGLPFYAPAICAGRRMNGLRFLALAFRSRITKALR